MSALHSKKGIRADPHWRQFYLINLFCSFPCKFLFLTWSTTRNVGNISETTNTKTIGMSQLRESMQEIVRF